jgi:VIT1/CCC1 family predicted Fe2+/Mn2+ transporter
LAPGQAAAPHGEVHRNQRTGWLRAATLGANDGLISTSSLVVGVASATPTRAAILLAAVSALVAGALAMAAGEYVSVSSQADTERADLRRERSELATSPQAERAELAEIYVDRGLSPELAKQVADQKRQQGREDRRRGRPDGEGGRRRARCLDRMRPRPCRTTPWAPTPATSSASTRAYLTLGLVGVTLALLLLLGAEAARLGGASRTRGALRVVFWGAAAMACTAAVGHLAGSVL